MDNNSEAESSPSSEQGGSRGRGNRGRGRGKRGRGRGRGRGKNNQDDKPKADGEGSCIGNITFDSAEKKEDRATRFKKENSISVSDTISCMMETATKRGVSQ